MTLGDAINGLGEQTEWLVIKDFIKATIEKTKQATIRL